jgi:hypothetical protein
VEHIADGMSQGGSTQVVSYHHVVRCRLASVYNNSPASFVTSVGKFDHSGLVLGVPRHIDGVAVRTLDHHADEASRAPLRRCVAALTVPRHLL